MSHSWMWDGLTKSSALNRGAYDQKMVEKYKKEMLEEREQKTKYFIKLKELQALLWKTYDFKSLPIF